MSRAPAAVVAPALLALVHGMLALVVALLMLVSGLRGQPITTPVQLLEPELPFLQAGVPLDLIPGAPPLPVTENLIRAVAAGNIAMFSGAGVLWLLAAAGLWGRRRSGRILALVLFVATALIGVFNLGVETLLLVLAGEMVRAAGGMGMAVAMLAVFSMLTGVNLTAVVLLARPAGAAAFQGGAPPRPLAVSSLAFHFALVTILLLPGVLAPSSLWPVEILVGPWLVAGLPARLVTLMLAAGHGACAWGWWSARRWAAPLSLWLNVALVISMWSSAAWADDGAMAVLGAGILPPGALRVILMVAGGLGCLLLLAIHLGGRHLGRHGRQA